MTSTMEHAMGLDLSQAGEQGAQDKGSRQAASTSIYDLDKQRLRILRCTAQAMASSPGGLRFKAGDRPWLEGVPGGRPASATGLGHGGRRVSAVFQPAGD
ncbi:hypothetical protein LP416_27005 [Polaromonas sp. P2-4]|nr:hypothetical protein LP416_27005 [Polaromonas sp. P2-4]